MAKLILSMDGLVLKEISLVKERTTIGRKPSFGLIVHHTDPEREYVEVILPRKLALQADYAARATLASDLAVILRTLRLLIAR